MPRRKWRAVLILGLTLVLVSAYPAGVILTGLYYEHTAEAALVHRDFQSAGQDLEHRLALWPHKQRVLLLAAQTARRRGDRETALDYLDRYARQKGSREAILFEQKLMRLQSGQLADAEENLAFCISHPGAPEASLLIEAQIEGSLKILFPAFAMALTMRGGPGEAEALRTRRAIDFWLEHRHVAADQVQGLIWRGRLNYCTFAYEEGVTDLRKALQMDPESFQARWYLGVTLSEKEPREAAVHLERLWRQHPDNRALQYALASLLRSLGRLDEARPMLDAILEATPDHVPALLERAKLAIDELAIDADTQHLAQAELLLRRAEAKEPEHPQVIQSISRCLQLAGRVDEANRYHERFREIEAEQKRKQDEMVRRIKLAADK